MANETVKEVQEVKIEHGMKEGLKKFHAEQRKEKPVEEAVPVVDAVPQVRKVQVKGLENGVFRIGPEWIPVTKGKDSLMSADAADYLRSLGKVV
jgi:hypothetical protein